ncbi:MAG: hypothetical protein WA902_17820, partial [Thermosynechococcaceae cyanobacterium]
MSTPLGPLLGLARTIVLARVQKLDANFRQPFFEDSHAQYEINKVYLELWMELDEDLEYSVYLASKDDDKKSLFAIRNRSDHLLEEVVITITAEQSFDGIFRDEFVSYEDRIILTNIEAGGVKGKYDICIPLMDFWFVEGG